MTRHVVVVGDVLLDREVDGTVERFCPDAPAPVLDVVSTCAGPGGAGLATLLCAAPDLDVTFVGPIADDADGAVIEAELAAAGVRTIRMGHEGATRRKTRVRSGGHVLVRLDDGGPGTPIGNAPEEALAVIRTADAVLVSCYGGGVTSHPQIRAALAARAPEEPVVWDPHPRGARPVTGCLLVSPNLAEARTAVGDPHSPPETIAATLRGLWQAHSAAVTAGADGVWLATADGVGYSPAPPVGQGDPCGAGDRFAAGAVTALARGSTVTEAVGVAVAEASAWVAAGGAWGFRESGHLMDTTGTASSPGVERARTSAAEVVARVHRQDGTVVATGGCFDVLHPGHLESLEAARRLGDALIVLLNSDASVRRLKGPGRPVQPAADRARLLLALECVDAVAVFEEDDPRVLLDRLRPDVWAKGGDYAGVDLTEADLVRSWGGRVVLLPYLAGRSTTALLSDVG